MPPKGLAGWLGAALLPVVMSSCGQQPAAVTYKPSLTYTRWAPDPKAMAGPEPGYKPEFTGLTGADVAQATPAIDASGSSWLIDVTFTPRGKQLFAVLTRANVAECAGDVATSQDAQCAQRHLAIWLDLTETDVDNWDKPDYVAAVSGPFDLKCLARQPTTVVCGKLVSDPITLEEIDGGVAEISGNFTQATADQIAIALNSRSG